jgi:hypothetical protein
MRGPSTGFPPRHGFDVSSMNHNDTLGFAYALPYFARHSDQDDDYTQIKITLRSNWVFETAV